MSSVPAQHPQGATPPSPPEPQIVLRDPGDLIAYLPYEIGYHPGPDDVAFLGLRGTQTQGIAVVNTTSLTIGAAEIDPGTVWRDIVTQILDPGTALARARAGHDARLTSLTSLAELGVPGVILVSYGSPGADAFARAVQALDQPALIDVLRVSAGRWRSLTCGRTSCCPPEGRPLDTATAAAASAVAGGSSPRATRDEVTAVLDPGPADLRHAVAAHLPAKPGAEDARHQPPARSEGLTALRAARLARSPGTGETAPPAAFTATGAKDATPQAVAEAARLLHALEDPQVRDECLAWGEAAAGQLWRDLIRYAPDGWAAPVATAIAVHALCNHDRALARMAIQRALDDRPGYTLASLLHQLLVAGADTTEFTAMVTRGAADAAPGDSVSPPPTGQHEPDDDPDRPAAGTSPGQP